MMKDGLKSLVAYGTAPWQSALPVLRLLGPAEAAGISVVYGNEGPDVDPDKVFAADLVVIQRDFPRFARPFGLVLQNARQQGLPVIYELDDLLLDLPEEHVSYPDLSVMYLPMIWAMVEADAITVSTPYLAERLSIFNPNTWVLPNYLNDQLWTFQSPHGNDSQDDPIVIGYMGGQTHRADLQYVLPALKRILDSYARRVRLCFWGGEPPSALRSHPQVSWTPLDIQDYAEFARFFAAQRCDIFICPLVDNRFNRAKSTIKFLEYSALGVAGVYSRILPYESIVQDGKNGLLASAIDEWVLCLQKLVEDPDLRLELGWAAQRTVQQGHLLSQHAGLWEAAYLQAKRLVRQRDQNYFERISLVSEAAQQTQESIQELEREKVAFSEEVILKTAELEAIHQSQSWRLATKIQQLRERLAPPGSRREKALARLGGR
jgi:glycosyltransferase involved in cell wall biosynthesis